MESVLSTKRLNVAQKNSLLKAGLTVVEHDFIRIDSIPFGLPPTVENAIFTSQNTVKALKNKGFDFRNPQLRYFCVGKKTKSLLEENGAQVEIFEHYGKDLAHRIVERYATEKFTFFCGNRRRNELPTILKENEVLFEEVEVYKTHLSPKKMTQKFDGILFFSPSGVKSFCSENMLKKTTAFCIGTTTAAEARKYTGDVEVAKEPTIESVIESTLIK